MYSGGMNTNRNAAPVVTSWFNHADGTWHVTVAERVSLRLTDRIQVARREMADAMGAPVFGGALNIRAISDLANGFRSYHFSANGVPA